METKVEKLKESRIRTTTIVPVEAKKIAEEQAVLSLGKKVRIKGFREGMAPPAVVREHITAEQIQEEMVRVIMPTVVTEALKTSNAKPIIRPSASVESLDPLTITLLFVERPVATLKKPEKIAVEKKALTDASTDDIDHFVHTLLMQDHTETMVDREAKKGDIVKIGLVAKEKNGTPIEELTIGNYSVMIGHEEFLHVLEPHLVGMKKGEKKNTTVDFPKDFDITTVQGKKITLDITVNDVAEVTLPTLTAAYLHSRLGAERTPEAFREDVKQMLTTKQKNEEMKRREEELYAKTKEATQVEIAPELIDTETQEMLSDLQDRLKKQEMTLEQWLKSTGKEAKDVIEEMKGIAKDRIILRFGMQALAEWKKMEPDATKLAQAIAEERKQAESSHSIREEDWKPGGNAYEQILFNLRMQQLVQEMIKDEA